MYLYVALNNQTEINLFVCLSIPVHVLRLQVTSTPNSVNVPAPSLPSLSQSPPGSKWSQNWNSHSFTSTLDVVPSKGKNKSTIYHSKHPFQNHFFKAPL